MLDGVTWGLSNGHSIIGIGPLVVTPSPSPSTSSSSPPPSSEPTATASPSGDPSPQPTVTVTQTVAPTSTGPSTVSLDGEQWGPLIIGIVLVVMLLTAILFSQMKRP